MSDAGIFRELHATVIPVGDLDASVRWYGEVIGLTPLRTIESFLCVLGTGGPTNLCLYVPEPGVEKPGYQGGGAFPNFRTDDIDATRAHLVEHGVTCTEIGRGPDLSWFTFYDLDQNRIDVCTYTEAWLP